MSRRRDRGKNLSRSGFAPGPGPLSLETSVGTSEDGAFWLAFLRSLSARGLSGVELVVSDAHQGLRGAIAAVFGDCVRAGFAVIDPREVMTAGIEGDPGRAMAGSMAALSVTIACLNDQEWEATASQVGMGPSEREGMRCLLAQLSGPGKMAEAMIAAGEGDFTDLSKAGAECGLDMGPAPGQTPVRPPPTPTGEAPTPVYTPVPTRATPTGTPATPTPAPEPTVAPPVLQEAVTLTIAIAPIPTGIPAYSRSQWKHWVDADGDCQDARQEVLIAESLVPVTFETDRKCRVETGRWFGVFTGAYFEDPGDVDVDHMVPLKNAHNSGEWDWSPAMKEEYANNLGDDDHLIAVQDNANQSKGARGPDEWMPPDETYWCQYAQDWAEIKARWKLTMTDPEAEAVMEMLQRCENPPDVDLTITVPASVPSLFHSSFPFVPSLAWKNSVPSTFVSLSKPEAPIRLMSFTMAVPPAVPSLFHSSLPLMPSSAVKNRVPFTFT